MKRTALLFTAVLVTACNGEKLTGPAAQDAAARHRSSVVAMGSDVVFVLDGREISATQFEAIDAKTIESIEVVKGEAARALLKRSDARAVIFIESKR